MELNQNIVTIPAAAAALSLDDQIKINQGLTSQVPQLPDGTGLDMAALR